MTEVDFQAQPCLIDTSALIESLRVEGNPKVGRFVGDLIRSGLALTTPAIIAEVMRGAREEAMADLLRLLSGAFHCITGSYGQGVVAGELGRVLRSRGSTIPTVDLLVAAAALEQDAHVIHRDAHFDLIARHSELRVLSLLEI